MIVAGIPHRTVEWQDGVVHLIDQRLLPFRFERKTCGTWQETADAIRDMTVRGAGAIGATAAFAVAQAAYSASDVFGAVAEACAGIRQTRPTARNLFAGVEAIEQAVAAERSPHHAREAAVEAAIRWADADADACQRIGEHGKVLFPDGCRVATHCNAGWLAFVDWGSALSPIYAAFRDGHRIQVWVDETRPRGQGAKLTAWELAQEQVPHTVIADSVLGSLMQAGRVDRMIVGADRIAKNGDTANKIGTYAAAVLAKAHGIPFYVAAPLATIDRGCESGAFIPIEERDSNELRYAVGETTAIEIVCPGAPIYNPAFDVTPARLISGFITERGIVSSLEQLSL